MSNKSISTKLSELFEMYESGVIKKEEFELLKSELISGTNKQTSETIEENQKLRKPELSIGSETEENTKDDGLEEVDNNQFNEEEIPEVISKPLENKKNKQKPIGVFTIIGLVVLSVVVVGLSLHWISGSNLTKEKNENQDFSFDSEVYDTSTDRNAPYLNVRSTPHSESLLIYKLKDGDKVSVLESGIGENNGWLKIKSQNNTSIGFVHGRYIRKIGSINEGSNIATAQSAGIETFLKAFFKEYQNKSSKLSSTIHPEIGLVEIINNNRCVGSKSNTVKFFDITADIANSFNRRPNGSRCEGYEDEKDGIYFFSISTNNFPSYITGLDSNDNFISEDLTISNKYLNSSDIFHVFLIGGNWLIGEFYFTRISGKWYLICQDFCGCGV